MIKALVGKLNKSLNRPIAVVLVGMPGSGKSTWVRENFDKAVCLSHVLSTDDYIMQYAKLHNKKYNDVWAGQIRDADNHLAILKDKLIASRQLIMFDDTNLSKKRRQTIINQLPKEYKKYAIVFDVNDVEIQQRLIQRENETGKYVPATVLNKMHQFFELPEKEEGFDEIFYIGENDNG